MKKKSCKARAADRTRTSGCTAALSRSHYTVCISANDETCRTNKHDWDVGGDKER